MFYYPLTIILLFCSGVLFALIVHLATCLFDDFFR